MKRYHPKIALIKPKQSPFRILPGLILILFGTSFCESLSAWAEQQSSKTETNAGFLPELQLNKSTEAENVKSAAEAEVLISKSEESAIQQLQKLLKKYKGSSQEPDLLFRLAELYTRRAKTGRFIDLYKGEKTLSQILNPQLLSMTAKGALNQSIVVYLKLLKEFPHYPARDEVLFNIAFAYDQKGDSDSALNYFTVLKNQFPDSFLMPEAYMALGEIFFLKRDYQSSQNHFDQVKKWPQAPVLPLALFKSSWCSYNLKNTPEALQKLENLLRSSKDHPLTSPIRSEARRDLALFFSEIGETKNSITYFSQHLLPAEVGTAALELATLYDRHGRLEDMNTVLSLFLKSYPKDPQAGTIILRQMSFYNDQNKHDLVVQSLRQMTSLCDDPKWKSSVLETKTFCQETLPHQLHDLIGEWMESWNKNRFSKTNTELLDELFNQYFKTEAPGPWNIGIHLSYGDFLFSINRFSESFHQYQGVSQIESIDPTVLHNSLYGSIISLDKELETRPNNLAMTQNLFTQLNEYLRLCPSGKYTNDVHYKKAFLFYKSKDFTQALDGLQKIKSPPSPLQEKVEDLTLEIYRTQRNLRALESTSSSYLKTAQGARFQSMKQIYQAAQQMIIKQLMADEDFKGAAVRAESFYREHRPEKSALEQLYLSIELFEKLKLFRNAAVLSQQLAKEQNLLNEKKEAANASQHAVQLFLKLGDIRKANEALTLAIDLSTVSSQKKESLELLAETSSWLSDSKGALKAWDELARIASPSEKTELQNKKLQYLERHSPKEASAFKTILIEQGVEPYASEDLLEKAQQMCLLKKWIPCYQLALKLNRDNTPTGVRMNARYLQSKVLGNEYYQQSLRAKQDRVAMVIAYKAEKFDKTVQVLNGIIEKTEISELKLQALHDLNSLYKDYVTELQAVLQSINPPNGDDMISLHKEISDILPILKTQLQNLNSIYTADKNKSPNGSPTLATNLRQKEFPELQGDELRIFVPTWEESHPVRPLNEINSSSTGCSAKTIAQITTLSALGREANQCLLQKHFKEMEVVGLKISDLFPDSPWGPFYLSVASTQQKSLDMALWLLKLSQSRTSTSTLLMYEDLRQKYLQSPSLPTPLLTQIKSDDQWAPTDEMTFFTTLDHLKSGQCVFASKEWAKRRSDYWNKLNLSQSFARYCPPEKIESRALSSLSKEDAP